MPPPLPDFDTIPIAFVLSTHLCGDRVKEFAPASFLKESNSTPLKFGLFIVSHNPRNSMVSLTLNQFLTTSLG